MRYVIGPAAHLISVVVSCFLWCTGLTTFVVCVSGYLVLLALVDGRKLRWLERRLGWMVALAFGQVIITDTSRLVIRGGPGRLYMFNHASYFDVLVFAYAIPEYVRAVGAAYHFRWPLWGHLLRRRHIVSITRTEEIRDDDRPRSKAEKRAEAIAALESIYPDLRAGEAFIISPEGTRSHDGRLLDFKHGPFHTALATKADIIVFVITGADRALRRGSWLIRPGVMRARFEVPLSWSEYQQLNADQLRQRVRQIMQSLLQSM